MIPVRRLAASLLVLLLAGLGGCEEAAKGTFTILSGSENQSLQPIVTQYCAARGWQCEFRFQGSVDIKLALEDPALDADAVWPAHGRWIELGDKARRVKHARSIMTSPVVFAVRDDIADRLKLKGRPVMTAELVELVRSGELRFLMTSATQSNSGFSAYIGMLTALAGNPEVLTPAMMEDAALRRSLATLLKGVQRTAGSSAWLADLYIEGAADGRYTAMVNYESIIIETNGRLTASGLKPLYVLYPADGTAIADSPLGYVSRPAADAAEREAFFKDLQAHLLSEGVQRDILASGRRTGIAGVTAGADPNVFRAAWGIDLAQPRAVIRFPAPETLELALNLYQEVLRKPSFLVLCLDYSGSMAGRGEQELESAIDQLFDPPTARRYLIQASREDRFVVIPFDAKVRTVIEADGVEAAAWLGTEVRKQEAGGGTDIYSCAAKGLEVIANRHAAAGERDRYLYAIILMTDGRSNAGTSATFTDAYRHAGLDVPVFGITFGDADASQLDALAQQTTGRVFDGRKDLTKAFRHARGYN